MDARSIERLTALASPARISVEGEPSFEERHWVVRIAVSVSSRGLDESATQRAGDAARAAVREARIERHLEPGVESQVRVRFESIDERHIIAAITTIALEKDDAHAWLVATATA